ncbi:hypothetical protein VNN41_09795 [Lactococcus garvieae]|uniref:hypothetical protein n=1 Tax=Lactococcus garvieae TaxID=1363 RepID=UPI0032475542
MKKHKDNLKQKMKKNVAATKTIMAGTMVSGIALLIIGTQFAPDRNIVPSSQLETTQQFSTTRGGNIEITSQEMDWQRHIMKVEIQASDELSMKNLEASVFIKNNTGSTIQFIPTVDNKATIFIKNLSKNFEVLSLVFEDKGFSSNDVDTQIFDDKQSAKSSEASSATKNEEEARSVYFYISENSKYLKSASNKIQLKAQKDYAIDALNDEIHFQNDQVKKMKTAISKLSELQKKNKAEIEDLKKQNEYLTGNRLDNNQEQILDLQSEIKNAQDQTKDAEANIQDIHKKIDKMNQQISDIKSGSYEFPVDSKTQKLK